MIDPLYRMGHVDRSPSPTAKAADASPSARGSKFATLMYAMLKPPVLDLADANGDDDDAPRPPMKAHVQPNLMKLMQSLESGPQAQARAPVAQAKSDGKQGA